MRLLLHLDPIWDPNGPAQSLGWNSFGSRLFAESVGALHQAGVPFDFSHGGSVKTVERMIRAHRPDAVLTNLHPTHPRELELFHRLRQELPWVMLPTGFRDERSHRVSLSEAHAMELLIGHLRSRGYRSIGFVSMSPMKARVLAWRQVMAERGPAPRAQDQHIHRDLGGTWAQRVKGVEMFLRKACLQTATPLEAVMASNDVTARALVGIAKGLGLRVPEDLAITGVDGSETKTLAPTLTTIEVDLREIARQAVSLALRLAVEGPTVKARVIHVPGHLRIGESTGRPTGDGENWDARVAALLTKCWTQGDPATVLAEALHCSRAYFLRKYRLTFGERFPAALARKRAGMARHYLEKGLATPRVMELCGFTSARSFYRQFKRTFGVSPENVKGVAPGATS